MKRYNRTGSIVVDIETIPTQNSEIISGMSREFHQNFKVSSSLNKDQLGQRLGFTKDQIPEFSKTELQTLYRVEMAEEEFDKVYRETAFDGGLGEIISIGWRHTDSDQSHAITRTLDDSEAEMLEQFNNEVVRSGEDWYEPTDTYLIGHHIPFDIKFMWKRYVVNKIQPSFKLKINGRHEIDFYDTMQGWNGYGHDKCQKSHKFVCNVLGIPLKTGMDGSMVWDKVQEGKYTDITKYNLEDVDTTFEIYKRLNFDI